MKTKSKSILSLVCLLAASGCTVSTGRKTQGDPRYDLNLSRNRSPNRISHYEEKYDIFRGEFVYEAVPTREYKLQGLINWYNAIMRGEYQTGWYGTWASLSRDPWLMDELPKHQIEWMIQGFDTYCKEHPTSWKVGRFSDMSKKLSGALKERVQKEIRTSSLQQLCESPDSDVDQVRSILSLGCDVNAMNENGYPPLHLAVVTNKNVEFVTVLLEAGADVTTKCQGGKTALQHAAAENKNPEVFAALLEEGSDVNAKFEGGTAPLHSVVSFNPRVEIVRLLLKYGADVNAKDQQFGITPLHAASAFGTNPEVISVLLQAGANANLSNQAGQFPLDMARDNEVLQGTEALDKLTEATNQWLLLDSRLQRP